MNTTYLQLANDTQYQVSDFWQQRGIIEVKLSLLGVSIPLRSVGRIARLSLVTSGLSTSRRGLPPCELKTR